MGTKLPEKSACDTLCPGCTEPTCKCPADACWPGKGLNETRDHTCECFAELGFCKDGEKPVYTPGKKCPSCWPAENKACDCFAAIGFCKDGEEPVYTPGKKCPTCWPKENTA